MSAFIKSLMCAVLCCLAVQTIPRDLAGLPEDESSRAYDIIEDEALKHLTVDETVLQMAKQI